MREWAEPEHVGRRREPVGTLRRAVPDDGATCLDLDGDWEFQLRPHPEAAELPAWRTAQVPGCWTTEPSLWGEVADPPWYTNDRMPWPDLPPTPPTAHNPTGVHRRDVTVPADWSGRRVLLHVGAAESLLLVRVDGQPVGSSTDSHLAAEFDITPWAPPGSTVRVELTVVKWSAATFVEDQDQWWHGGITRSVRLFTRPVLHLSDVRTVADAGGRLSVDVRVGCDAGEGAQRGYLPAGWRVDVRLGRTALAFDAEAHARDLADERLSLYRGRVRFGGWFPGIATWTAETPVLHDVTVDLRDADGALVDSQVQRVGFRTVEVVGPDLLVNGRRIFVRGVNRHDRDPLTGRVVTTEQVRQELLTFKRFGFNAVRTSHYPNDPSFYDLTDELGFYVVDEANIESHAWAHELCDDPAYLPAFTQRVARMVRRDRNHPSVIIWSLGNESDYGANHDAVAAWVRRDDPTRPVQYEGAIKDDWNSGFAASDIVCPMYASLDQVVEHVTRNPPIRPVIQCEYSHAMGNSNGSLSDYWAAIESLPGLQGGFIWEFADHGLLQRTADGLPAGRAGTGRFTDGVPDEGFRWAHGGDFGDTPHDGAFCLDGVVLPDGTPKPVMFEHRELASPVRLSFTDGVLRVRNAYDFSGWGHLRGRWVLEASDGTSCSVPARLPDLGPGCTATVEVPAELAEAGAGERWLQLVVTQAEGTAWNPAGAEVSRPCVRLPDRARDEGTGGEPGGEPGAEFPVVLTGDGALDLPGLVRPELTLWRDPTDNDDIAGDADRWVAAGLRDAHPVVVRVEGSTVVSVLGTSAGQVRHTQRFRRDARGLHCEETVELPEGLDDLPRIGVRVPLTATAVNATWFGTGPWETYPDRCTAPVGWHDLPVRALAVPYVRPQENGARTRVRELRVRTSEGESRFSFDRPVTVTVHEDAVVLDVRHRGLGTASCGPNALPQHRTGAGTHTWSWSLAPGVRVS
ncbi:glycoside hydrolase family 2 TIM barrel-domain containing protein [Kineococcus rhizosphaerae]|uniref:Beta-galactosidase n=1 Tax=Kineococcus rhizosphaerae TaxID=559628 RepID=A0A2T0R3E9_9ACTN|nr:glycoside hydrolase family 2 TIM barrel-domain containing protein [Kineococcus rhizosphaerae]PRY14598.1 beta-galactosidase [Kineococcus rhizosphaerae]